VDRQRFVFEQNHVHEMNKVILNHGFNHMLGAGCHFVNFFNHLLFLVSMLCPLFYNEYRMRVYAAVFFVSWLFGQQPRGAVHPIRFAARAGTVPLYDKKE
jgi:hypothetical protein